MRRLVLPLGISAVLALAGAGGCKTVPLRAPDVLEVAANLSLADTRLAVFEALAVPAEIEHQLTTSEAMADKALRIGLWPFYRGVKSAQTTDWFAESVEANSVRASYQRKKYLLSVDIRISRGSIAFEIADAQNLRFSNGGIHKSAYVWIDQLKAKIRRSLGQVALRRASESDRSAESSPYPSEN